MHHVQATMLGDDVAVTTAYANDIYIDPETGEETIGHIRQTMVLQKTGGKWKIVHHHASMQPTE
jgi:ketosteroid isomerase-like protein